ncbi:MAG: zinc finger domain-containing protein [Dermatophilaceae bacterium]
MPEGHTLHRLAATLDEAFAGTAPRASSPQGRFVEGAALLDGRLVERADAWGKHLFVTFAGDVVLNVHLGLIGVFDVGPYAVAPPPPVGAVRLRLVNDTHVADLRAMTLIQVVSPEEFAATVARLGPDPLRAGSPGHEPERALARLARTGRSIAECLMDQSVLAGVGNVYRCEVLFRHRVDPFRPGKEIRPATFRAIWDDLVALMPVGVVFGQIITLPEQVERARELMAAGALGPGVRWQGGAEGELGRRGGRPAYESLSPLPRSYAVYKRTGEPCLTCGSRVRTAVVAGRNLYWCGRCQRRR